MPGSLRQLAGQLAALLAGLEIESLAMQNHVHDKRLLAGCQLDARLAIASDYHGVIACKNAVGP